MSEMSQVAREPEELARLFVERFNARDVDGLVALYERDAAVAAPDGRVARGEQEIGRLYADLTATGLSLAQGEQHPPLRVGEVALTSTRLVGGGATAEVARRQSDGSWRWVADRPRVV
jgi:ketosteroid isomerase-like protein